MISVNLLPEEFRRRERTPLRVFAATLAAAVVVAGLGAGVAYLRFGQLVSVQETLARIEEDRQGLEPMLKHHAALSVEIAESEKWHQTIYELRAGRINWTTKLDQFVEFISVRGDQGLGTAWFDEVSITQTIDNKTSGGTFALQGHIEGDSVGLVADLISASKEHPFYGDFVSASVPEGKTTSSERGVVVDFPLTFTLAPRDPKKQAGAKPLAENRAGGAAPATGATPAPAAK
ncbi:MAG: hypothetical protein JNJ88_20800 [Planctomycetes bacterium]|nr:hypothetical protein [Planctomycetota bacterium]